MRRFDDKTALVTGGTTGIGRRTVARLRAEGARVITTGRSAESVARAQRELGDGVVVLVADAAHDGAMGDLAEAVGRHADGLDVVVLNAGVSDWRPLPDWDEAGFDRVFDVNVRAPFFLLQALLPQLRDPASVVVTGSNSALGGWAGGSVYGASKAAVTAMARSWAVELLDRGVRVNVVSPGPTDTALFDKLGIPAAQREAAMRGIAAGIPAGRMGDPDEIAAAIAYLASDDAAFANGTDLVVDGGVTQLHAAG